MEPGRKGSTNVQRRVIDTTGSDLVSGSPLSGSPASITPQTLVSDLLGVWPQLANLFVQKRFDCVGCSMARFCSLADVSQHYEMNLQILLDEIKEGIQNHEGN